MRAILRDTPGVRISPRADHSGNAFDFLRVVAAFAVLFSHSFALMGLFDPFLVLGFPVANIGVYVFFVISGFLVSQSWDRDPSLARFAARRGVRLMPGLIGAVCFTVFVIGPLMTTLPAAQYFGARDTWTYLLSNVSLAAGQNWLPGVFEKNPYPIGVNGSLWTLRYEALLYVALAVAALATRRVKWASIALLGVLATGWTAAKARGVATSMLDLPYIAPGGIHFDWMFLAVLGAFFFAGSVLYVFRDHLRLSIPLAVALAIPCMLAPDLFWGTLAMWLFLPYATLVFAYRAPAILHRFGKHGDWSYGIYVYAFPVQQVVSSYAFQAAAGWFAAFAVSSLATIALAALSWHWIESPCLQWKASWPARRGPPAG